MRRLASGACYAIGIALIAAGLMRMVPSVVIECDWWCWPF